MAEHKLEAFEFDLSRWSDKITGKAVLILAQTKHGKCTYLEASKHIRFINLMLEPPSILESYKGNTITINGFRIYVKRMTKLLTAQVIKNSASLTLYFEIDVNVGAEISYDIARDKIIGSGRIKLAFCFWDALLKGLYETGIWDKIENNTQKIISNKLDQIKLHKEQLEGENFKTLFAEIL